jgi:hypothetical protein
VINRSTGKTALGPPILQLKSGLKNFKEQIIGYQEEIDVPGLTKIFRGTQDFVSDNP